MFSARDLEVISPFPGSDADPLERLVTSRNHPSSDGDCIPSAPTIDAPLAANVDGKLPLVNCDRVPTELSTGITILAFADSCLWSLSAGGTISSAFGGERPPMTSCRTLPPSADGSSTGPQAHNEEPSSILFSTHGSSWTAGDARVPPDLNGSTREAALEAKGDAT